MAEVLVVAPHMDDEALGCGGLIQRVPESEIVVAFVSEREDDQRFHEDGYVSYQGASRAAEMTKVARYLEYRYVRLGFTLHQLDTYPLGEIVTALEGIVREQRPSLILVPGPSNDEDHRVVWNACQALLRPHFWQGSMLQYWVWGAMAPWEHALILPLTDTELRRKESAVDMYHTQHRTDNRAPDSLYPYSPDSVLAYAGSGGRLVHAKFAEMYTPVRLVTTGRWADMIWAKQ